MFSMGCFDEETIERNFPLNNVFNDLRPIFNRLIFQLSNVFNGLYHIFTHLKFELSFVFNDLRHIYIRNKVAIFNELKIELINYDLL